MHRILEKYSPAQHPIINKFIGNIDQVFLEKLVRYECYWNWLGPELTEKEIEVARRKYVKEDSSDTVRIPSNNGEDDDEVDPAGLEQEWLKLSPNSIRDYENNHSIAFLLKTRSVAKKIFWLIYLDKIEAALVLLNEIQTELTSARSESLKMLIKGNAAGRGHRGGRCRGRGDGRVQELCIFSLSYTEVIDAYTYLFDGLEAYLMLKTGKYEESWKAVKDKPEFHELSKKGQVLVVYFKLGFLTGGRKYFVDIKDAVEKLVELDPNTSHWYRGLYFYSCLLRRQESLFGTHSDKESHAVLKAYKLDPNSPLNIGNLCKDMAEVFRIKEKDDSNWPVKYGDITFPDQAAMYKYMLIGKAKEIFSRKDEIIAAKMEKPFLALVSAFSSILPYYWRDLDFAKVCIDCALEIDPKSTIGLHRKALLIMKQAKQDRYSEEERAEAQDQAEEILRQINDEFAFYPLHDLLSLLLRNVNKNKDELQELLAVNITKTEIWNQAEVSKLYFLKGCLNFMCEEFAQAFDDWMECFALDSKSEHFDQLELSGFRFDWCKSILNINNVHGELQNLEKSSIPEEKWIIFDTMSGIITKLYYDPRNNNYEPTQSGKLTANGNDSSWPHECTSSLKRGGGRGSKSSNFNWYRGHRYGRGGGRNGNVKYIPRGRGRGGSPCRSRNSTKPAQSDPDSRSIRDALDVELLLTAQRMLAERRLLNNNNRCPSPCSTEDEDDCL